MKNNMMKKIILLVFLIVSPKAFSQVGIGTTDPRGALEINSATTGFLAPQVALSDTTVSAPVVNPTGAALLAGTIVYNTASVNDVTPGYYYWNGTIWVRMEGGSVSSTQHNTLDEAYDEGGAGAGRIINSDSGAVEISNTNTTDPGLAIINNSTASGISGQEVYVVNDNTIGVASTVTANGAGILVDQFDTNNPYSGIQVTNYSTIGSGILTTTEAGGPALSVEATATSNASDAMTAYNFRTNGGAGIDAEGAIGIRGTSQVATGSGFAGYLNAAQGAAGQFNGTGLGSLNPVSIFTGNNRYGLVAQGNPVGTYSSFNSNEGAAYVAYLNNYAYFMGFALVTGGTLYDVYQRNAQPTAESKMMFNVVGPGINATTIKSNDKTVIMPAVSAPESLFQDYGTGKLVNGRAQITINPILSEHILVDKEHPLKVFVQLEGECNGVYVTNKSATGFEVVELSQGTSDVSFSYSIIASRASMNATTKEGNVQEFNAPNRFMTIDVNTEELQLLDEEVSRPKAQKKIESQTKK